MEDNNKKSPEQQQDNVHRHTPANEDAAKQPQKKTDAPIEEAGKEHGNEEHHKKVSADTINSIIGSATDNVRSRRHHDTFANTGTNVSYEGPTSTAAGGTGYNSGQSATGARIASGDEYDAGGVNRPHEEKEDNDENTKDTI